jgi:hypothetical protein
LGKRELAGQSGHLLDHLTRFMVRTRTANAMLESHAQIIAGGKRPSPLKTQGTWF